MEIDTQPVIDRDRTQTKFLTQNQFFSDLSVVISFYLFLLHYPPLLRDTPGATESLSHLGPG